MGSPSPSLALEIVALQHLLKGYPAIQIDDIKEGHFSKPIAVKHNFRSGRIENLECLVLVGFGIGHDLFTGQHRPS